MSAAQHLHVEIARLCARHDAEAVRAVFAAYVAPVCGGADLEQCIRDGVPREIAIGVSHGLAQLAKPSGEQPAPASVVEKSLKSAEPPPRWVRIDGGDADGLYGEDCTSRHPLCTLAEAWEHARRDAEPFIATERRARQEAERRAERAEKLWKHEEAAHSGTLQRLAAAKDCRPGEEREPCGECQACLADRRQGELCATSIPIDKWDRLKAGARCLSLGAAFQGGGLHGAPIFDVAMAAWRYAEGEESALDRVAALAPDELELSDLGLCEQCGGSADEPDGSAHRVQCDCGTTVCSACCESFDGESYCKTCAAEKRDAQQWLRVARASARWVWDSFDKEQVRDQLEVDEETDQAAYELLVRKFYTIAVANRSEDIPALARAAGVGLARSAVRRHRRGLHAGVQAPLRQDGRAAMKHRCHARGCTRTCRPEHLMCAPHWRMVPLQLQRNVWRHYRPGQCDDKRPSREWHEAADAAIAAVADAEARAPQQQLFGGTRG